jgi:hypothetical protein
MEYFQSIKTIVDDSPRDTLLDHKHLPPRISSMSLILETSNSCMRICGEIVEPHWQM